jgi:hypothetical protein
MHAPAIRARTAFLAALLLAAPAAAQQEPKPIQDNSFLLEEAYNQESGVVQHINTLERANEGGAWGYALTQEWPLFGQKHQLSYSIPVLNAGGGAGTGIGDVTVDYRYQLVGDGDARLAVAPRLSVLLPTGDEKEGRGEGRGGAEIGLPVSFVLTPALVAHTNAAFAYLPEATTDAGPRGGTSVASLGQSLVWLAHPRLNVLVEAAWENVRVEDGDEDGESLFISPGLRAAFDVGRVQVVPGIAVPIGVGQSNGERSLFLYLSLEHAYRR